MIATTRTTRRLLRSTGVIGLTMAGVVSLGACSGPQGDIDAVFGPVAYQATKIAQCESKMNPNAVSPTNDHGLFQINYVHRNTFTQVTGQPWSQVYNPFFNTLYAKHLYNQQGWSPWSCRSAL